MKQTDTSRQSAEEISRRERLTSRLIILVSVIIGILITVLLTGVLDSLK